MPTKTEHLLTSVKQQILNGEYACGDKFPAGRDFAARFNISYITANNVLQRLEQDGFLIRYPRKGSFVTLPHLKSQNTSEPFKAGYFVDVNVSYFSTFFKELLKRTAQFEIYNIPLDMTPTRADTSPEEYQIWLKNIFSKHYNSVTIYADRHFPFKELKKYEKDIDQINFIFYDSSAVDFPEANRFIVDLEEVGYLGASHLFKCGATKIIMSTITNLNSAYRLQIGIKSEDHEFLIMKGIERAFVENNIDFWKNFKSCPSAKMTESDFIKLIRDEKFNGFFSLSDFHIENICYAANALELKLGKDIFCVETGNSSWHNIYAPHIDSIVFNAEEIARLTADAVLTRSKGQYVSIKPQLIVHKTN